MYKTFVAILADLLPFTHRLNIKGNAFICIYLDSNRMVQCPTDYFSSKLLGFVSFYLRNKMN